MVDPTHDGNIALLRRHYLRFDGHDFPCHRLLLFLPLFRPNVFLEDLLPRGDRLVQVNLCSKIEPL